MAKHFIYRAEHQDGRICEAGNLNELSAMLGYSVTHICQSLKRNKPTGEWVVTKEKPTKAKKSEESSQSWFEVFNNKRGVVEFWNRFDNCAEYIGCSKKTAMAMLNGSVTHRTYTIREVIK